MEISASCLNHEFLDLPDTPDPQDSNHVNPILLLIMVKTLLYPSSFILHPFLYLRHNRGKDGNKFIGFFDETIRFGSGKNTAPYKQVKPIIGFVQFL